MLRHRRRISEVVALVAVFTPLPQRISRAAAASTEVAAVPFTLRLAAAMADIE